MYISDDKIDKRKGHNLRYLMELWEGPEEPVIIEAMIAQFSQHGIQVNDRQFWDMLERNKEAFQDWRYYYQRGGTVDITFLCYDVAIVLNNMTIRILEQVSRE